MKRLRPKWASSTLLVRPVGRGPNTKSLQITECP